MGTYFFYQQKHAFADLDEQSWQEIWEQVMPIQKQEEVEVMKPKTVFTQQTIKEKINPKPLQNKPVEIISLNEADAESLTKIKGIGAVFSDRIVKYREKLGGFHQIEQLLEVYGISEEVYGKIKNCCLIKEEKIRKININQMSVQDLAKHPYMDYKKAKILVAFRETHGLFDKTEDLLKIALIDSVWLNKIKPYLAF